MAYMKSTLISRPTTSNLGVTEALGGVLDTIGGAIKGVASGALDLYGAGLKAKGAQDALAAQVAAQQAPKTDGGISTTTLLVGGAVLAGVLVFAMRRK